MSYAYFGGGPGMLVSGLVWLLAGVLGWQISATISVIAFFVGGMFIVPLAMLLSKLLNRPGKHAADTLCPPWHLKAQCCYLWVYLLPINPTDKYLSIRALRNLHIKT